MTLSTHVLDTESGLPVGGLPVFSEYYDFGEWQPVSSAQTDERGRIQELVGADHWRDGRWRLIFDTSAHYGPLCFWPQVTVEFVLSEPSRHHHIPLLLSRHGYSTYRGS